MNAEKTFKNYYSKPQNTNEIKNIIWIIDKNYKSLKLIHELIKNPNTPLIIKGNKLVIKIFPPQQDKKSLKF